jgi:hypothetical protein
MIRLPKMAMYNGNPFKQLSEDLHASTLLS